MNLKNVKIIIAILLTLQARSLLASETKANWPRAGLAVLFKPPLVKTVSGRQTSVGPGKVAIYGAAGFFDYTSDMEKELQQMFGAKEIMKAIIVEAFISMSEGSQHNVRFIAIEGDRLGEVTVAENEIRPGESLGLRINSKPSTSVSAFAKTISGSLNTLDLSLAASIRWSSYQWNDYYSFISMSKMRQLIGEKARFNRILFETSTPLASNVLGQKMKLPASLLNLRIVTVSSPPVLP